MNMIHFRYRNHELIHQHYIHNVDNRGTHDGQQNTDHIYLLRCFLCMDICHLHYILCFQILVRYKCILKQMVGYHFVMFILSAMMEAG